MQFARGVHTSSTGVRRAAACAGLAALVAVSASSDAAAQARKRAERRYQEYRVPAGTYLPIELRTRLSSNTAEQGGPVDGRLLRAVEVEGVELVPAGASVLGTITEVQPAGKKQPGRIVFAFHVIEHPETGSRAMIRGTVLSFASDPPKKGKIYPELRLEGGTDVSISLLAPLTVRIPIAASR